MSLRILSSSVGLDAIGNATQSNLSIHHRNARGHLVSWTLLTTTRLFPAFFVAAPSELVVLHSASHLFLAETQKSRVEFLLLRTIMDNYRLRTDTLLIYCPIDTSPSCIT